MNVLSATGYAYDVGEVDSLRGEHDSSNVALLAAPSGWSSRILLVALVRLLRGPQIWTPKGSTLLAVGAEYKAKQHD
jgi:hypothetical protein